jgi:hypothetical protein
MTLFEKLFALLYGRQYCAHKWVVLLHGEIGDSYGRTIGRYFDLQCEKCGDIKRKNSKA